MHPANPKPNTAAGQIPGVQPCQDPSEAESETEAPGVPGRYPRQSSRPGARERKGQTNKRDDGRPAGSGGETRHSHTRLSAGTYRDESGTRQSRDLPPIVRGDGTPALINKGEVCPKSEKEEPIVQKNHPPARAGQPVNTSGFSKRIGSVVYEVTIHFNQDAKETMDDKILRLIKNEAQSGKAGSN